MAAKTDLKTGIKNLMGEMESYDGTEGKTKAEADEYFATQLADLIDVHAKALVAKIGAAQVTQLAMVAGPYPVVSSAPADVELAIDNSLTDV